MLNYNQAIDKTLKFEGGYSNDQNDSGGETYCGISRNNWPNWEGWAIVDEYKPLKWNQIINDPQLISLVQHFYITEFIVKIHLDLLKSQIVFNKVFDMCVNMGSYRGIVILQQALVNYFRYGIGIDGVMGKETADNANRTNEGQLVEELRSKSKQFYEELVNEHPRNAEFLNNWLSRAES